jgi:TPP-dependent pyruvate/acetoin dehydrogenase alpha subunit
VVYNQRFIRQSSLTPEEKTVTTTAAVSTGGSLIADTKLRQLYATMVQCRLLTERALRLRKRGRIAGLYGASMGQEAIATGCVIDLLPGDSIALEPDDSIAGLVKGVPLSAIVAELHDQGKPAHNIITASSPGEQLGIATRVALAYKRKKNSNVVIAFTSQAATVLPCWHQALKLAAARTLPIIFVVENNPWNDKKTDAAPLTERNEEEALLLQARKYGLTAITVDGNDVVAVYRVAYESLERVRQGGGPVMVEGKTYRTHDQPRLRNERTNGRDPLTHMERYLRAKKLFTLRWKNQLLEQFSHELDAAIQAARKLPASPPN